MKEYVFKCAKCGSENIQLQAWVRPNTMEIVEETNPNNPCWCEDCVSEQEYECIEL